MDEKNNSEESTITLKKSTLWKIATFVFAGLFVISLFTGGFGLKNNSGGTGNVIIDNQNDVLPGPSENVKVSINSDDPVLGNKNADISIVEFSDFQCPFCARVHSDALAKFKQSNYFKSGEVNLVYKQFPLNSIHPQAQKAAEASVCASKQGKFWEYHD
ncbi:MAG: DsbA family protein, partial [Candidatus Pacearchaeota archaeon]